MKTYQTPTTDPARSVHDALRAALGPGLQLSCPTGASLNAAVNCYRPGSESGRY